MTSCTNYTASHPGRLFRHSPSWEPDISHIEYPDFKCVYVYVCTS